MVETRAGRKAVASTDSTPSKGYTTSSEKTLKRASDGESEDFPTSKRTKLRSRTDYSKWRLLDEKGRQTWHYLADDESAEKWPQSTADKYFLGLPTVSHNLFHDYNLF